MKPDRRIGRDAALFRVVTFNERSCRRQTASLVRWLRRQAQEATMQRTQGVFLGLASLALVFAVSAQPLHAQQDGPAAQSPAGQRPPSPGAPSAPSPSSGALGQAQAATTATGEVTDVDTKTKTITVKTVTGPEMKFKYDDATKIGGAEKGAAGLATMTGKTVIIQYKKDGQSNLASNIEVRSESSPTSPRSPEPTSPRTPGSPDPTSPRSPGSPDPTSPRSPGQPDAPRP